MEIKIPSGAGMTLVKNRKNATPNLNFLFIFLSKANIILVNSDMSR